MKTRSLRFRISACAAIPALFALLTSDAAACAVCFGAPGSDLAESMSFSILFMIGVTALMLSGLSLFICTIHRRSCRTGPRPQLDEFGADILPDSKS